MNFLLIIAPAVSINYETVFVICSGCNFYHKLGALKKEPTAVNSGSQQGGSFDGCLDDG